MGFFLCLLSFLSSIVFSLCSYLSFCLAKSNQNYGSNPASPTKILGHCRIIVEYYKNLRVEWETSP